MPYSHITWGDLKTLLAARLGDTLKVTWTDTALGSELGLYLAEALRTFQGLTGVMRTFATANLAANESFYDLPALFPSQLGYSVYDQELIGVLQYHLYERYSPAVNTMTEMFTLTDLIKALSRARNRFVDETGMLLTKKAPFNVIVGDGKIDLNTALGSDRIIDVVRAQWIEPGGRYRNIWPSDMIAADGFKAQWSLNRGIPYGYSTYETGALTLQLTPPNIDDGQLDLVVIEGFNDLDPTAGASGTLVSIPDNFVAAIKWAALADLLNREGQARDVFRAELAKKLYTIITGIALQGRMILAAELDGAPVMADTMFAFDAQYDGWQGKSSKTPTELAIASHNLIAVRRAPDSNFHSIGLHMISNAIVPASDAGKVQIGREHVETILDFAEFLALYKLGSQESDRMLAMLSRFTTECASYNGKVAGAVKAAEGTLTEQSNRAEFPRRRKRAMAGRI